MAEQLANDGKAIGKQWESDWETVEKEGVGYGVKGIERRHKNPVDTL